MWRTRSAVVISAVGAVTTCLPSRSTVARSHSSKTSSRRWLTNSTATPRSRRPRTIVNSRSTSCADSDAVGSSRMRTPASTDSAFAISISCWSAIDSPRTGAWTSKRTSSWANSACAWRRISPQSTVRSGPAGAWPMNTFSATLRSGNRRGSWWTTAMPERAGVGRAGDDRRLAVDLDRPGVRLVHAREDLDERALARAVLADQRVDLARAEVERHVGQRLGRRERLGHAAPARRERRRLARPRRSRERPPSCGGSGRDQRHVDLAGAAGRRPSRRAPGRRSGPRRARRSGRTSRTRPAATSCGRRSAMTRRAAATMERLICASSSVASERPGSRAKPAAPRNAVWTLIRSNSPSPRWPTTDIACQRTRPPVISTVIPCVPASSVAIRRPLVITVSPLQPPRCRDRAGDGEAGRAGVHDDRVPVVHERRGRRADARLLVLLESLAEVECRLGPVPVRQQRATVRPDDAAVELERARSLRMVTVDTPNRADSSLTRTRPCSATRRAMSSWRSRAKTSPGAAPVGTVTRGLHTDPIAEVSAGCRVGRRASWAEANRNVKKPD